MSIGLKCGLCLLSFALAINSAFAEIVQSKGMALIPIAGGTASNVEMMRADFEAKENSIQRYLSEFRPTAAKIYAGCPLRDGDLDGVIVSARARPAQYTPNSQYQLKMRTAIDLVKLDLHLQSCTRQTKKRIAIVLVSRQKITQQQENTYKAFYGQLDKALGEVLESRNFVVDSKQDMEIFSGGLYREDRLIKQYEQSGQVNWEPARIAGYISDIDLMVVGYFDIGQARRVSSNNLMEVSVSGSAQIFHMADNVVVSSTPKIQLTAEARTGQEAITEAAQLVVEAVGVELADKLNAYSLNFK
jgi:hypothetical protein